MISLLNYFQYTMYQLGLPEDWLERDLNFVNQIEKIACTGGQIESLNTESNQVENGESNQIGNIG